MIIVEGPDNAGKTTLVEIVADRVGVPVAPPVGPEPRDHLIAQMRATLALAPRVICDRWNGISDQVYGPVIRGRPTLCRHDVGQFMMEAAVRGAVVVYCRPPLEVITARHAVKPHESLEHAAGVASRHREIVEGYDVLFASLAVRWSGLRVVTYDWTTATPRVLDEICAVAAFVAFPLGRGP